MKFVYFAWVRERIGRAEEELTPPPEVRRVDELLAWLSTRGEEYAHALAHRSAIRVALDRRHVGHDAPLAGASDVALFPPMTGG